MGGFGVVVDWERPVDPREVEPMMGLVPHRATGGVRVHATPHAVLAEGRTTSQVNGPWEIATLGSLSIVGDIRLYDTSRLRAFAGGSSATVGLDDRQLILAAIRRRGMGAALDAIDGDYAFVVWDDERRRVLAVRDRFAVKPIFFEETPTGIRFASEVKQLAATSSRPIQPEPHSIAEFIDGRFTLAQYTFFTGIHRVQPSHAMEAAAGSMRQIEYWDPSPSNTRYDPASLPSLFRRHLTDAVDQRLATSASVFSHLSGGFDSSSITAAAADLARRGRFVDLTTISAVFDLASIDESTWINDIVAMQPFPHLDFAPRIGDIDLFDRDMWIADGPLINIARDMVHVPAQSAAAAGADLLLTGRGGDDISYQGSYLADILRSRRVVRFAKDTLSRARWLQAPLPGIVLPSLRQAAPTVVKSGGRWLMSRYRSERAPTLAGPLLAAEHDPAWGTPRDQGRHSSTQNIIASALRSSLLVWLNELHAQSHASHGVDVSHPYLDRRLAEFVVSIHPIDLPYDGRSKTLVRQAFSSQLPTSVLERRTSTYANEYLERAFVDQRAAYRSRFPDVAPSAKGYVDPTAYRETIDRFDRGETSPADHEALTRSWHLMAWLDLLGTYRRPM